MRSALGRARSASVGSRPCGVYMSTALGSSRESRASSSCCDSPVCCDRVASTSGPIACSRSGAASALFGPVPTHEAAASPWPFCWKRLISSPRPPLRNPPAPAPPRLLPNWPSTPASPPCCGGRGAGRGGRIGSSAAEHLGDLVPVLITREREQSEQGRHGWKPAAHEALLFLITTETGRRDISSRAAEAAASMLTRLRNMAVLFGLRVRELGAEQDDLGGIIDPEWQRR